MYPSSSKGIEAIPKGDKFCYTSVISCLFFDFPHDSCLRRFTNIDTTAREIVSVILGQEKYLIIPDDDAIGSWSPDEIGYGDFLFSSIFISTGDMGFHGEIVM